MRFTRVGRPLRLLTLFAPFQEQVVLHRPGVSPASQRWQAALLQGLEQQGTVIEVLSHVHDTLWPRGPRWRITEDPSALAPGVQGRLVSYWNLPWLRSVCLSRRYARSFRRRLGQEPQRPDAVVAYNVYPWTTAVAVAARKAGIPFVVLYADLQARWGGLHSHVRELQAASGVAFLSHAAFDSWTATPKLHLDGGIRELRFPALDAAPTSRQGGKAILYTGTMGAWAGIDLLLDAFGRLRRDDVELWACGPGRSSRLEQAARRDPRVRAFGLVPDGELQRLCREAFLFVNPRRSSDPTNAQNFPSKVLEYLSHGKPVVSTWTAGLSPEYRQVLEVVETDDGAALAKGIEGVLDWTPEQLRAHRRRAVDFLVPGKTWSWQARRLLDWLATEVMGSSPGVGG